MVGVLMLSQTTTALFKRFVSVASSLFIVICFKNLHFVKLVRLIVIDLRHKQTEISESLSFLIL